MSAPPGWKPPTPAEHLESFIRALEERADSAQEAINRAYEDIGRYTERKEQALKRITQTRAAIQRIREAHDA